MKQIINRKLYNTETANLLCRHSNYNYVNFGDYKYFDESLYRKKTGEFFLYCAGGAGTIHGVELGNSWRGAGEHITPLSEEEVKEWLKKRSS